MNPRYREVIVLHELCGLTYAEVGQEIQVSNVATVRQIHSRALSKLRDLVNP